MVWLHELYDWFLRPLVWRLSKVLPPAEDIADDPNADVEALHSYISKSAI